MKKIVYLTGTRAEFGLMKQILLGIEKDKKMELQLLVTGMHLMKEFGETVNEVKKEFKKVEIINAIYAQDNRESMARFLGKCSKDVVEILIKDKPEIVIVLGDRA